MILINTIEACLIVRKGTLEHANVPLMFYFI